MKLYRYLWIVLVVAIMANSATAFAGVKKFYADGQAYEVGWGPAGKSDNGYTVFKIHFYEQKALLDGRFASVRFGSATVAAVDLDVLIVKNFIGRNDGVVLVASMGGSGGYMDYDILAFLDGKFTKLHSRANLAQGQIKLRGAIVEEWSSGQKFSWAWNGRAVMRIHNAPEKSRTGVRVVKYSMRGQNLFIRPPRVTLHLGEKIVLEPVGNVNVRTLLNGNKVLNFDGPGQLKAIGIGRTFIDFIPNQYDWNGAKKLHVVVE